VTSHEFRIDAATRLPERRGGLRRLGRHPAATITARSAIIAGMTKLVNLDPAIHRDLRVEEELAFSACKDITMCAVTPTEIPRLILEYPVAFTKHTESGQFLCVAVFGVDPQANLYWREGRWNSRVLPLNVGRQPFFVGQGTKPAGADNKASLVVLIDEENPGVQRARGEPLFGEDGRETPYLQRKMAMLAELIDGEQRARVFTERLASLGLIRPIQLTLTPPGRAPRQIGGLFSIDHEKLRSLEADVLVDLNAKGYLHVMHAMLLSLEQFPVLATRAGG
jgi:hypothetical protein